MVSKDRVAGAEGHMRVHIDQPGQDRCSRTQIEHLRKTLCTACQLCLWSNRRNRVAINDHIGMFQGTVCHAIVHSAGLNHYWSHRCSRFSWLFCCYCVSLSAVHALRYSAEACPQDHQRSLSRKWSRPTAGSRLALCYGCQFGAYCILAEFCLLRRDVNPIQTRGIFAENLALDLQGQIDTVLLFDVVRQLKRHKLLNQPLGGPDGIVAAETQLVWTQPEQQIR